MQTKFDKQVFKKKGIGSCIFQVLKKSLNSAFTAKMTTNESINRRYTYS
jgi:hypothetical protein